MEKNYFICFGKKGWNWGEVLDFVKENGSLQSPKSTFYVSNQIPQSWPLVERSLF